MPNIKPTNATNLTVPYTSPQPTCPLVPPQKQPQSAIPSSQRRHEVISTASIFLFGIVLPIIMIAYITISTWGCCCCKRTKEKRASSPDPLANKITTIKDAKTSSTTAVARKILSSQTNPVSSSSIFTASSSSSTSSSSF